MLLAAVERDQTPIAQLERHSTSLERAEIDPQRVVLPAEERGELVEQAGLGADPAVLDPRAEASQFDPLDCRGLAG